MSPLTKKASFCSLKKNVESCTTPGIGVCEHVFLLPTSGSVPQVLNSVFFIFKYNEVYGDFFFSVSDVCQVNIDNSLVLFY